MNAAVYVLWAIVMSATTGEVLEGQPLSDPLTLDECLKAQVERGPVPVMDGKAAIFVCTRPETGITT